MEAKKQSKRITRFTCSSPTSLPLCLSRFPDGTADRMLSPKTVLSHRFLLQRVHHSARIVSLSTIVVLVSVGTRMHANREEGRTWVQLGEIPLPALVPLTDLSVGLSQR